MARGVAHILAIEALDELGVRIASITGTSIGAVVGAMRAAGLSGADLRRQFMTIPSGRRGLALKLITAGAVNLRFFDPAPQHWAPVDPRPLLAAFLPAGLPADIGDLPIPSTAVATDIDAEAPYDFVSGPLVDVLAASAATPGLMRPVRIAGRVYVDGAVLDPVPVRPARVPGVPTVAVDLTAALTQGDRSLRRPSVAVLSAHMVLSFVAVARLAQTCPALVLRPAVRHWHTTEFHRSQEILGALEPFKDECKRAISTLFRSPRPHDGQSESG